MRSIISASVLTVVLDASIALSTPADRPIHVPFQLDGALSTGRIFCPEPWLYDENWPGAWCPETKAMCWNFYPFEPLPVIVCTIQPRNRTAPSRN